MAMQRRERKVVTVLFCDLVGFTSRAEALDPEDVEAILRPVPRTRARRARTVRRHGREVHRRCGDGAVRRPHRPRGRRRAGRARSSRHPRVRSRRRARAPRRDHYRRGARLARREPGRGRRHGVGRRRQHGRATPERSACQRRDRRRDDVSRHEDTPSITGRRLPWRRRGKRSRSRSGRQARLAHGSGARCSTTSRAISSAANASSPPFAPPSIAPAKRARPSS